MLAFAKAFTIFAFAIFVFAKAFALDRSFAAAFFWHAIFAFAKAVTIFAFAIFVFARFAKDLGLHRSFADARVGNQQRIDPAQLLDLDDVIAEVTETWSEQASFWCVHVSKFTRLDVQNEVIRL